MLTPDLLDRRAIALLALLDGYGLPVQGPVAVSSPGLRWVGKTGGRIAILDAPGFAAYTAAFAEPPSSPAKRTKTVVVDLTPSDPGVLSRRISLKLPRDPDPAKKDDPLSLFQPVPVQLSPSPRVAISGNACILRASVRRSTDSAFVEGALVRAQSADGKHSAWALTDASGEAALVFPALPVSFTGAGGTPSREIACSVLVHADPASARFATPATLPEARRAAAARREGHVDPDVIADANAVDFDTGQQVRIAAGSQPAVSLQWTAP
jgi:hypothetical protein